MKLIINTSNLYVGGGLQVALSFINELRELNKDHQYHIFLSQATDKQTDRSLFPANFHFYLIERSPASLKTRKQTVAQMDTLEEEMKPDVVFSVFGPSYWKPKAKHVMGFAVPWVLQKDSVAYSELPFLKLIKMRLWVEYVAYYTKRDADHYIIETEDGKRKMSEVLSVPNEHISVVGNSYSAVFDDAQYVNRDNENYIQLPSKSEDEFRLLTISHNHPHKNIKIIKKLLPLLKDTNITFVLTLDEESYNSVFAEENPHIINLGSVVHHACPSLYTQSDAIFLPTLLEVFSAAYPEAMKMEKTILTSNYSFATDICQEAALYFDPLNPKEIAQTILKLKANKTLQKELVEKGNERVKSFETARSRAEKYLSLCENIVKLK